MARSWQLGLYFGGASLLRVRGLGCACRPWADGWGSARGGECRLLRRGAISSDRDGHQHDRSRQQPGGVSSDGIHVWVMNGRIGHDHRHYGHRQSQQDDRPPGLGMGRSARRARRSVLGWNRRLGHLLRRRLRPECQPVLQKRGRRDRSVHRPRDHANAGVGWRRKADPAKEESCIERDHLARS